MEGNRRPFFKERRPQFKKKGGSKKGKWHNSSREQSFGNSEASDTVYRILCYSKRIGSVIGKGGNRVKALREETQAKITVSDSVAGSDERVIIIHSPSTKKTHEKQNTDEDQNPATENEDYPMEPHCPAQDALLKVHDRIVEEDLVGGMEDGDENVMVTARLLVANNMVGCLLGRKGDVIQRLRSDTGAGIRVLPAENLPTCAMSTDELVQISGKPAIVRRALYDVSTLLHQNPKKDNPSMSFPLSQGGRGFHPIGPPIDDMPPRGNLQWSQRHYDSRDMPPMPWMGGYGDRPFEFGPDRFDRGPPMHGGEAPSEFSMKILCPVGKIGGVIGTGGSNVKQLETETGASVHVGDASAVLDERVIRVSSLEVLWNPRSETIDAILQLQNKTSEVSEKGIMTTRLLVPSTKVGCILGQGGNIINEMRRRTQADIRVFSKEDKPKSAADDEELVQISGKFGVAKDALVEIASRLRARYLRDGNAGAELSPVRPVKGFGPGGSLHSRGPDMFGPTRTGSSSAYEYVKGGGREYEFSGYPVPPSATRYSDVNSSMDVKMPYNAAVGTGGRNMSEIAGTRLKLQDPRSGGAECIVDIHGSSDHLNATQNIYQAFVASSGQNTNPPQDPYRNYYSQQSTYPQNHYVSTNPPPQAPYENMSTQQPTYQNMSSRQAPYQHVGPQGSYQY
ncbi:KH domain-containing protein HEN4-like [Rhododendron vialii]|uniref:KH domain-containing protein HEN4-like n=1 Tax=Rhododendron vialii TaxID=182163 RepID=UPI00265E9E7B|nr:KH domain-containing protein HEN4-like [Rhododendron vialii]XP_058227968.1 KH domain-containing protein HEN4-like [Rhododendron vialii]XP_058227969.1 KH domain-containing protein HEN4-like [Rhododendron vialii]